METIRIITSCTGQKARSNPKALTDEDFMEGAEHIRERETQMSGDLLEAGKMYTGRQHQHLMKGVNELRASGEEVEVKISIVSAGYGVLGEEERIAPYDMTFANMTTSEARKWALRIRVPEDVREVLRKEAALHMVLLGNDYLEAAQLIGAEKRKADVGGRALFLCSASAEKEVKNMNRACETVALTNEDARRWGEGLVGLKGRVAGELLRYRARGKSLTVGLPDTGKRRGGIEPLIEKVRKERANAENRPVMGTQISLFESRK